MKVPVREIPVVVLVSIVIAAQEAVEVSLFVGAAIAEDGAIAGAWVPEKVRALRIVALPAVRIVRARVEAVPVALLVCVGTVLVAAVVRRLVFAGRVVRAIVVVVPVVVAVVPVAVIAVMIVAAAASMAAIAATMIAVAMTAVAASVMVMMR
ncbi:MAG TPA: hypothetical protein VLJ61_02790 [Pyrinomonadaceae bacterium]|nr:hypothetical protein [Pyrinomonadaceae bacterium]